MIARTTDAPWPILFLLIAACGGAVDANDDVLDPHRRRDAGLPIDSGVPADGGARADGGASACVAGKRLFFEDFESGDYSRWTGATYGDDWNGGQCHSTAPSELKAVSGSFSHRSEITCSQAASHRGYGGVQFSGDTILARYTNAGSGLVAPHGVVNTYWSWLDAPYAFEGGKWFSFFTVNSACDYSERVITLGLEDATNQLIPAHILNTGGTVTFDPSPPAFPMRAWVRTTIYISYVAGEMAVWMDGQSLFRATFSRPTTDMCQWHWGAYASGDNDDVVLFEDDISLWKLEAPLDLSAEPWFDASATPCN